MEFFSNIEVTLSNENGKFKALSPAFPDCVGVGLSEPLALKSLSRAISRFVAKISNDALNNVFLSERYSELLLDTSKKEKSQSRVYTLDSGFMSFAKNLSIKVKMDGTLSGAHIKQDLQAFLPKGSNNYSPDIHLGDNLSNSELSEPLSGYLKSMSKEDAADGDIVFGFMVNFN